MFDLFTFDRRRKDTALRHSIKGREKEKRINRSPPNKVSLFTPLPGRMLRQEQWRLTWLAMLAAIPPLFPLTFIAFLGGKPTNLLPVPIQYRVGFVLTRYACFRGARASRCAFIAGETRRKTRAACTGKKRDPEVALLADTIAIGESFLGSPLLEPRVDASVRAFIQERRKE